MFSMFAKHTKCAVVFSNDATLVHPEENKINHRFCIMRRRIYSGGRKLHEAQTALDLFGSICAAR